MVLILKNASKYTALDALGCLYVFFIYPIPFFFPMVIIFRDIYMKGTRSCLNITLGIKIFGFGTILHNQIFPA